MGRKKVAPYFKKVCSATNAGRSSDLKTTMKIPLIDLAAQHRAIQPEIEAAIRDVIEQGQYILGPNVKALESEIAAYLGVEFGVGVASGTDALVLALRALDIGQGDEVIVPAYTFFATAEAVLLVGATPVFVDVEPRTYGINVEQVARAVSPRTKAVIAVHLYGHPADMNPLLELARAKGFKVIEDNAQAFGADYEGGKTGAMGDIGCLSFFPSKNLGALGDGGMVVTNDAEIAGKVRMLRTHGWRKKYHPEMVGYNSRLDEMQAAILRVKLPHLDGWNRGRREVALRYNQMLEGAAVQTPIEAPNAHHVYHLYVLEVENRQHVEAGLKERGVPSSVYYPVPLHLTQPCLRFGHHVGDFPVSEAASEHTLAIPFFPEISDEQMERVVAVLEEVVGREVVSIGA